MKNSTGRFVGIEIRQEGETNNKSWTIYTYKIQHEKGLRFYSGFDRLESSLLGENLDIEFEEKPNPKNEQYPYLNVTSIKKSAAEGSLEKPITPETEDTQVPSGKNLLEEEDDVSPEEAAVMDKIKAKMVAGQIRDLGEADFVETLVDNCQTPRERGKRLFTVFSGGLK